MTESERKSEIIDELNDLLDDERDAGEYIIDCVIDTREDDGLPPFTPEELAEAQQECDRIADVVIGIEERMDALRLEYFDITGQFPHRNYGINRYDHPWPPRHD